MAAKKSTTPAPNMPEGSEDVRECPFICPFCGVGCNLELIVKNGKPSKVVARGRNPDLNNKFLCIKGIAVAEIIDHPDRIRSPMIRKNGKLVETDWDTAIREVAKLILKVQTQYFSEAIGVFISGKITNEEGYLAQKFARTVAFTNNIDTCARLCHGPSEAALRRMLGFGAVTTCLNDFAKADVLFLVGANTKFTHPGVWDMLKNRPPTSILIVADVFEGHAQPNIKITPKPKSDIYWLNGLARILYEKDLYDRAFVNRRTLGFDNYIKSLGKYSREVVEEQTGIPWEMLEVIAASIAGKKTIFVWGMGLTQHAHGTEAVMSLANIALLTGNIGKEGTGLVPLRGQSNVQGVSDMGCSPVTLTGGFDLAEPGIAQHFNGIWNATISTRPGLSAAEMIHEIAEGKIKLLYIIGENPVLSEPQASFVKWMFQSKELEGLIVQDIFMTETAKLASVVLPAAMTCEKEGLYTNADRRIQYSAKILDPVGVAKPDWEILQMIANTIGVDWKYKCSEDIWNEVRRVAPIFYGASYQRIKENNGMRWPVEDNEHPGTPRLYEKQFMFRDGRARFYPVDFPKFSLLPTQDYPYQLVTHRLFEHFNSGAMSRKSAMLMRSKNEGYIAMHESDFRRLKLTETDCKVRVTSPFGTLVTKAVLLKGIYVPMGYVIAPIHFFDTVNFNVLTSTYPLDAYAKMPSLKSVPVNIVKE
jgi:formate dehydrogenase alpha subunit